MAARVEDIGQPALGVDQLGLDDDGSEEAVEHDDVERLERLGHLREQLVELGELGVAQVCAAAPAGGRDGGAESGNATGAGASAR